MMSDGPSPEDFRAKVFRDREHPGDWRVEKLDDDGESIEVAIFSGGAPSATPTASTARSTKSSWSRTHGRWDRVPSAHRRR